MMWKVLVTDCCLSLRTALLFMMVVMVRAECRDDITHQIQILTSEVQHPDTCELWVFALQLYICWSMSLSLSFQHSLPVWYICTAHLLCVCVHMYLKYQRLEYVMMCLCVGMWVCVCACFIKAKRELGLPVGLHMFFK